MNQWDEMCIDYRNNEENIEVVDETQFKIELEPPKNLGSIATSSGGVGIDYNSDVKNRDYNKDEDVLSYLRGKFNPNWHEGGPSCPFWTTFCQLNFYQKFPNFFGGRN